MRKLIFFQRIRRQIGFNLDIRGVDIICCHGQVSNSLYAWKMKEFNQRVVSQLGFGA